MTETTEDFEKLIEKWRKNLTSNSPVYLRAAVKYHDELILVRGRVIALKNRVKELERELDLWS